MAHRAVISEMLKMPVRKVSYCKQMSDLEMILAAPQCYAYRGGEFLENLVKISLVSGAVVLRA